MMLSVNKTTVTKKVLNEALLAAGTASHAWFDDESDSVKQQSKNAVIELLGKQRRDS